MGKENNLIGVLVGGIWATPGVSEEPRITLVRWRVIEVIDRESVVGRHFVGYSVEGHEGRVSSVIQEFDAKTGSGVTRSGRVYLLRGAAGNDPDGDYVWKQWSRLRGFSHEKDVTEGYQELLADAGALHFNMEYGR